MKRLLWLAFGAVLYGCAAPPSEPALSVDTGTTSGEVSEPRNRARVHTELAALYYTRRNMAVALEELRAAQAADPNYAPAYGVYGLVYMGLRENRLAEQNFLAGLRLAPQDPDLNHNYGWFLCQTGREAESLKYFESALSNPLYTTPWRTNAAAGSCAKRLGRTAEAEQYFARALKENPNEPLALLQLAQTRYAESRYKDARRLVERFNKAAQPTAESLWLALRVERKLGARAAEQSFASQLRRHYPASRETQMLQRGEYE
jgi:type IV pilus assembly protein PilF